MNRRTIASVLVFLVVLAGAIGIGVGAYNAGVTAGLAQTGTVVVDRGAVVAPYLAYGWGYGHPFGFFGFLGGLLFLFLLFALIRVAVGGGRRGWGGPGWGGPGGPRGTWHDEGRHAWEDRARDVHDRWHAEHDGPATQGTSGTSGGTSDSTAS